MTRGVAADGEVEGAGARRLWTGLETIHAVTYFAPESREAAGGLGLKGFWMGYFAFRASPMGAVGPAVVEATFANFHPDRVRRALPDAWARTTPEAALGARASAAAATLVRILGRPGAEELARAVTPGLDAAVAAADTFGRPLFAANRAVARPSDPVAALWQVTTALREHRGDGHVALLTAAELDGCGAHVLAAAAGPVPAALLRESRGWSGEDWEGAEERLVGRGLLAPDGTLTAEGHRLRDDIEARTDALAAHPFRVLAVSEQQRVERALLEAAAVVAAAGDVPYPNPIGLPPVAGPSTGGREPGR